MVLGLHFLSFIWHKFDNAAVAWSLRSKNWTYLDDRMDTPWYASMLICSAENARMCCGRNVSTPNSHGQSQTCFIICKTLNRTIICKKNIVLYWRRFVRNQDHKPIKKVFMKAPWKVRRNIVIISLAMLWLLFATTGITPLLVIGTIKRMQVQGSLDSAVNFAFLKQKCRKARLLGRCFWACNSKICQIISG